MKKIIPYLVASIGIITDMITTKIAERLTFGVIILIETHAQYHPVFALIIFFSAITFLKLVLPKGKLWDRGILAFSLLSFIGVVYNILVILIHNIIYYTTI